MARCFGYFMLFYLSPTCTEPGIFPFNYFHKAAVISVFAIGYSMLSKKILKIASPGIQKFDLEDMGKLVAIIRCVRDDERVSHQTDDPTRAH